MLLKENSCRLENIFNILDNSTYINLKETLEMINTGSICLYIKKLSYCILSSIDMFRDEFLYLIENKVTLYSFIKD